MNILVLGASRGIGLEFVRQYRADGAAVTATARDDDGLARLRDLGATALKLDVTDPASISGLGWQLDGEKIDLALYVAGVMSHGGATAPPPRDEFDRLIARDRPRLDGGIRFLDSARHRAYVDAHAYRRYLAEVNRRMGWPGLVPGMFDGIRTEARA